MHAQHQQSKVPYQPPKLSPELEAARGIESWHDTWAAISKDEKDPRKLQAMSDKFKEGMNHVLTTKRDN